MTITCFIRYEIDPFGKPAFEQYARAWGQVIPRCGADLSGYFAPHEGSATTAYAAYSVESLPQMREPVAVGAVGGTGRVMATWPEGVEVSPGALLGLLNHQLYDSTPPEKYATLFLGIYDGHLHRLTYSNGGHLPPVIISEDGTLRRLDCGGMVVGLFDNLSYEESSVHLQSGEIFLAYSDGVTEPENEYGEFGEERLIELVSENRHLPLTRITEAVTAAVDDWIGPHEQPDDVTLVLARAR